MKSPCTRRSPRAFFHDSFWYHLFYFWRWWRNLFTHREPPKPF
jgi:hypothetical protein